MPTTDRLPEFRSARGDDAEMFDLAPVPLWLEDFSGLKALFAEWRKAGVRDLPEYLREDPLRAKQCAERIGLVKVNRRTLELFEAADLPHLVANLHKLFRDDMLKTHGEELAQLWSGRREFFSNTFNYTLSGQRLDIELRGSILPGHEESWDRVLVSTVDVTERESARRRLAASELYARGLFEHSPVSLWVEDFGRVKLLLEEVRERGITDLRVFTDVHPEFVDRCISEIRVLDVNHHTLGMFAAPDKQTLLHRISDVFRDDMRPHFREQLIDLWNGKLFQQREVVNYALDGNALYVHLQFSVLPGHERDWSLVQVALTDITARKKAEAYLEFLGQHDVLTKLHNRSFYVEELSRLERRGAFPVSIVMVDLNELKLVNDQLGHAAGDALLRRVGEVLGAAVEKPSSAARIGGDEFAVLLPKTDEEEAHAVMATIEKLVGLNNQFYSAMPISVSLGAATSEPGERLESVARRADARMYQAKRAFHARPRDRRRGRSAAA
ncbi:MAG: diguanylate cyclase domain-containing protein [Propylenella sp.]